ncbi:fimbrial biogenesis outer membrane usher protein [Salmonella enterica]|nr:fimbrial biogenesis outer membrane usher protein [Salmonella enterica]
MSIRPLYIALFLALNFSAGKSWGVEFNTHILDAEDRKNVDLSAFSQDGFVAPGDYLLDILLNGRLIKEQQIIHFKPSSSGTGSYACLEEPLIVSLALKNDVQEKLIPHSGTTCFNLNTADSRVVYSADDQSLSITVPQAWLQYQDENWIPPQQWDQGVNGFILDYNLLAGRFMPQQGSVSSNYSLYGTTGLNIGAWRLRSDYQYQVNQSGAQSQSDLTFPQTYLFRPLPSISSRLVIGQTFLNSDIFDSFRFSGVALSSDDRMLPPSLRGYAPQISGIAHSHAQVTVSQNGRIIWQSQVPAGPFVIPDLSETVRGNLDVTVREDNGQVQTWQVNTASVPFLARKGNIRYKTAAGKPLYGGSSHTTTPVFSMGEVTWGAFNDTSLYGGLIATGGAYQALALGVGQNMGMLGAASFDVTRSSAQVRNESRQTGYSYRFNYAKTFDKTGSSIAFAGYRFSEKTFMSMNRFLDRENGYTGSYAEKQSYVLTLSQAIHPLDMSLMLSMSHQNYWDTGSNDNYTLTLNKPFSIGPFQGATASLSVGRTRSMNEEQENQVFLSVTLPFGMNRQLSYALQHDSNGRMNQTATLYNQPSPDMSWNISAGTQRDEGQGQSGLFRGDVQKTTPYGQGDVGLSMQSGQYKNLSASWYGSFTATGQGAAFHQNIAGNEPRLMVDTGDVAGVPVDGGNGITNRLGVTVVQAGSSYEQSDTTVDVTQLPADVSVTDDVISKVLTEGAIGYRKISASKGGQMVATIRMVNGHYPPFGTVVKNNKGKTLGMIGDQGFTWLSGLTAEDRKTLKITWTGGHCTPDLPEENGLQAGVLLIPCR